MLINYINQLTLIFCNTSSEGGLLQPPSIALTGVGVPYVVKCEDKFLGKSSSCRLALTYLFCNIALTHFIKKH